MSLIKPGDVAEWKQLGVGAAILVIIASLVWAFFGSFFSELGKSVAQKAQAAFQSEPVTVIELPQNSLPSQSAPVGIVAEDASHKQVTNDDGSLGKIFTSGLENPK